MGMFLVTIIAATAIGGFGQNVVTPEWLEQNLANENVIVVEIGSLTQMNHPHIPQSRFVAIENIVTMESWPPDELPPVAQLRATFEAAGIGDEGRIVLYSSNPLYASRAWFTLDYLGHGERAAILDGGLQRWSDEKRPLSMHRLPALAKTFTPFTNPGRVVTLAQMREIVKTDAPIIDARPTNEFYGFTRGRQVERRGHIPGAGCDPWQRNLQKNGSFVPAEKLAEKFETMIPKKDGRVIVYCRTGMEASMTYFVLRSLGYDVALHDGSYTEWSRDKSLPVAALSRVK